MGLIRDRTGALSLLLDDHPQRIGLSATQKPIEDVARLLVGAKRRLHDGTPDCAIVDTGHRRAMELFIETPDLELGAIATHDLRAAIYDRIAALGPGAVGRQRLADLQGS